MQSSLRQGALKSTRALYHIKVYRMYQYFGYNMGEKLSNQKYRFIRYVSKHIFLAIKLPHTIPHNSVLLHINQFIANISHIWCCQKYQGAYQVLVQSIDDTICIRSMFRYTALKVTDSCKCVQSSCHLTGIHSKSDWSLWLCFVGVSIEISSAKDKSLTVVITGKGDAVMRARKQVVQQLQTQARQIIRIPKEHHRFILGQKGHKLAELELSTATKISIPRPDENSDSVTIIGTKEGIEKAGHEIQLISDEQVRCSIISTYTYVSVRSQIPTWRTTYIFVWNNRYSLLIKKLPSLFAAWFFWKFQIDHIIWKYWSFEVVRYHYFSYLFIYMEKMNFYGVLFILLEYFSEKNLSQF